MKKTLIIPVTAFLLLTSCLSSNQEPGKQASQITDNTETAVSTQTAAPETDAVPDEKENTGVEQENASLTQTEKTQENITAAQEPVENFKYIEDTLEQLPAERIPVPEIIEDNKLLASIPESSANKQEASLKTQNEEPQSEKKDSPLQSQQVSDNNEKSESKITGSQISKNSNITESQTSNGQPADKTGSKTQKVQTKPQTSSANNRKPVSESKNTSSKPSNTGTTGINQADGKNLPKEKSFKEDVEDYNKALLEQPGNTEPVPEPDPKPSRTAAVKTNQKLEITYPGSGWIYLGEHDKDNKFLFAGRTVKDGITTFTLRSQKSGKALLQFYKNDPLTGKYINDYIEADIENELYTGTESAKAPNYADFVPPKPVKEPLPNENETAQGIITQTVQNDTQNKENKHQEQKKADSPLSQEVSTNIQNSQKKEPETKSFVNLNSQPNTQNNSQPQVSDEQSGDLLEQAQKAYDSKEYVLALNLVRQYLETACDNIDRAVFLKGQILETKSEVRNIKESLECYNEILESWPQSSFWDKAKRRATYIRRFYIDIR